MLKSLFKDVESQPHAETQHPLTLNDAGGIAFEFKGKHALAQFALTGCLNNTYYTSAKGQLKTVLELCNNLDPAYIARTALYARENGHMKDMPALLTAIVAHRSPLELEKIFDRVIDDGKMLRNFVQVMRSGELGSRSISGASKRLIHAWLEKRTDDQIFRQSIGNNPSFGDVIRLVHPKPANETRAALYGYLMGRDVETAKLPSLVRHFEDFKKGHRSDLPPLSMMQLTSVKLSSANWVELAMNSSWQTLRQNLNTFLRHGVFEDANIVDALARRLSDEKEILSAKVMPYQLLAAYRNANPGLPVQLTNALQDAMEVATANIPKLPGQVYVFTDVSGSMSYPVSGARGTATSKMRYVDVAALFSAAVMRTNPTAQVIPFESHVEELRLNPKDSVMTNAEALANVGGGGTNCSAPLQLLNAIGAKGDLVIYISDNESWIDDRPYANTTETMEQWEVFKGRNPAARMVCIDICPNSSSQAMERHDILNIGGFTDDVFSLVSRFASGEMDNGHLVGEIEKMRL